MSKKYTLNFYIRTVRKTTTGQWKTNTYGKVISPLKGKNSVKVRKLNTFLNGNLKKVVDGSDSFVCLGKTPKARLLKALQLRKDGIWSFISKTRT